MLASPPRRFTFIGLVAALCAASAQAQIATYRITRTAQPPKLDGKLDDPCWKSACKVDSFGLLGGAGQQAGKPKAKTVAYLTYDSDAIYVAYRCEEPLIDQIITHAKKHDGRTWSDDEVEIFFNPSGDRERYCQLAINAARVIMDNYKDGPDAPLDLSYETGATAATHRGKGEWTIEVRIPFAGLPVEGLECPWTFHLARHRAAGSELITSLRSPTTGFHDIQFFDVLEGISLKDRRVEVSGITMGDMLQGTNISKVTLKNISNAAAEAVVVAGIQRAKPPYRAERKVAVAPGAKVVVELPWELTADQAGKTELLSVSVDGKVLARRERLLKQVPAIFGSLNMLAFYLDINEAVRVEIPIQLATGSRGKSQLRWSAASESGRVMGRGLTTVQADTAVVRLYWPRWAAGRYTLEFELTRGGKTLATKKQVVRLVSSPWSKW